MYLQPGGRAGHVISTVFFNGTLIRMLGMGASLTLVANNPRDHLLAELTP